MVSDDMILDGNLQRNRITYDSFFNGNKAIGLMADFINHVGNKQRLINLELHP